MRGKTMPRIIFFLTGFFLWALGGAIVTMAGYEPTVPIQALEGNKELATQVSSNWGAITSRVVPIWAAAGGILGLIICQLFLWRPSHEHYTRAPLAFEGSGMPGPRSGPKTMAEVNTTLQAWIIGTIIGICGIIYVLPEFQNELLVVRGTTMRIILGLILSLSTTVPILPFSLSTIRKIAEA